MEYAHRNQLETCSFLFNFVQIKIKTNANLKLVRVILKVTTNSSIKYPRGDPEFVIANFAYLISCNPVVLFLSERLSNLLLLLKRSFDCRDILFSTSKVYFTFQLAGLKDSTSSTFVTNRYIVVTNLHSMIDLFAKWN